MRPTEADRRLSSRTVEAEAISVGGNRCRPLLHTIPWSHLIIVASDNLTISRTVLDQTRLLKTLLYFSIISIFRKRWWQDNQWAAGRCVVLRRRTRTVPGR